MRSARTTRCRSTATFSFELRHKYNVRFILGHKDASRLKSVLQPARTSPKHKNIFRAKNNVVRRQMQTYSTAKLRHQVQITSYGSRSAQASSLLKFIGYKNHSAFQGKFKASSIEVFYPSGGGLEGATNSSRSIPSAIRVAAAMKVSMKDRKSCFLVLATLRAAILSSRAYL